MIVLGAEILETLRAGAAHEAKMVFNDRGAIILPAWRQHRELKAEGISYEDNYRGNALAAMLRRSVVEIRFHQDFTDSAVVAILNRLATLPELAFLSSATITYQGRPLAL